MKNVKRIIDFSLMSFEKKLVNNKNLTKRKKGSISEFAINLIKESPEKTNEEIASFVREYFGSKTSSACIGWYKSKMKKGEL
ncbi:MAG TPA: hypothetical protein ENG87_03615 [Candidatus Pacearchaeota archaeon]|nr:hypothetical protein [Candidatus Pacearchaeota archaeon]